MNGVVYKWLLSGKYFLLHCCEGGSLIGLLVLFGYYSYVWSERDMVCKRNVAFTRMLVTFALSTSQTERIGVNAVAQIVTRDLDWVWRELTIADFGIDGLIEQREDGRPNGKLIAVQIKSGLGNVKNSGNNFIYYASHTHKNYWSNYCIPVILVVYDPGTGIAYWTTADEEDFQKTLRKWKLIIPKNQQFSSKSERRLNEIFNHEQDSSDFESIFDGSMKPETLFDHVANLDHASDSYDSIIRIVAILKEMTEKVNFHNKKLQEYNGHNLSDKDPQVKATIKSLASSLHKRSQRIQSELVVLAEAFSDSMYSLEIVTLAHFELTADPENVNKIKEAISRIPAATENAVEGIDYMEGSFKKYPKKYPSLKVAKEKCLSTTQSIREEFNSISEITENFIKNVEGVQRS